MDSLLFDANISYRIKKKIEHHFIEPLHVTDINLPQPAKDNEIWEWAYRNQYTIVSYDEDFELLNSARGFPPKLILLKIGNQSTQVIAETLINLKEEIETFLENTTEGILEIISK